MRLEPCILGTVCLPWNEDFSFAENIFRKEVGALISDGIDNLYIFGTAGEGYALTDKLFKRIAAVFFDETKNSNGIKQVGIIGLSVAQIKERIEIGMETGFRSFQISLPSWGRLNDKEMYSFFDDILGSYPTAEFLHYNTPRGLRKLSGREYARIAADHHNLVATKSGSRNLVEDLDLIRFAPELCHFLTELDYAYASQYGACGLLISITALNCKKGKELFVAGQNRDVEKLISLTKEVREVLDIIFSTVSSGQHMDGAFDKIYSKVRLSEYPLRLLPPYQGCSEQEFDTFISALKSSQISWLS